MRSTDELEALAAAALKSISHDQEIKAYLEQNPVLHTILLRAAQRFIGGETLAECLGRALTLQKQGNAITIDYMGENTQDEEQVQHVTDEFLQVIQAIDVHRINASVSLDLSHIGLAIDRELALQNAAKLAQAAHRASIEMMISAEDSTRTDAINEACAWLGQRFDNVGITLSAYLYRTADDLQRALKYPGRIRLVKGAFAEPAEVARSRGAEMDAAYCELLEIVLASGHSCSIATHDPAILDHAHRFMAERSLNHETIEFEMLQGVTPERLQLMRERGYSTRVYLPYGREWYLYLCYRLAEYPPNVYQALADAIGTDQ